jgi:hypothetical protein
MMEKRITLTKFTYLSKNYYPTSLEDPTPKDNNVAHTFYIILDTGTLVSL